MSEMNRRAFLKTGSMAAVAAGAVVVIPGQLSAGAAPPPAHHDLAVSDEESAQFDQPLFAQVRNLRTGEISVMKGEQEVIYHDRSLANRIYRASQ